MVPDESFAATRINPNGELPAPVHPMDAKSVLNARDRFVLTADDEGIFAAHATQLAARVLVDRQDIVRGTKVEAEHPSGTWRPRRSRMTADACGRPAPAAAERIPSQCH